jgi:hypothetical protein
MIIILTVLSIALLIATSHIAFAGGPDTVPSQPQPAAPNLFYCPPINSLHKDPNTHLWAGPTGWQSYDISFVDTIQQFSGAQWRGTNVGQIFCVYRGPSATDFPVLLAYKVMTYTPQGGKWSHNLGGYQNCESPDPADCPFSIRVKPPATDIYEQAEKLKSTTPPPSRLGF